MVLRGLPVALHARASEHGQEAPARVHPAPPAARAAGSGGEPRARLAAGRAPAARRAGRGAPGPVRRLHHRAGGPARGRRRAGARVARRHVPVPPDVAAASEDLNAILDEADAYCREGRHLLTLATPPEGRWRATASGTCSSSWTRSRAVRRSPGASGCSPGPRPTPPPEEQGRSAGLRIGTRCQRVPRGTRAHRRRRADRRPAPHRAHVTGPAGGVPQPAGRDHADTRGGRVRRPGPGARRCHPAAGDQPVPGALDGRIPAVLPDLTREPGRDVAARGPLPPVPQLHHGSRAPVGRAPVRHVLRRRPALHPSLGSREHSLVQVLARAAALVLEPVVREREAEAEIRGRLDPLIAAGGPLVLLQPIVRLADGVRLGAEALSRFPGEWGMPPDVRFAQAHQVGDGVRSSCRRSSARAATWTPSRGTSPSTSHRACSSTRPVPRCCG